MAVKLAVLKSGEDVIADIREMMVGDEDTPPEKKKVVGYYFIKPCGVTLKNKAIDVNETADDSYELKLFPWCPLAKNDAIPMSTEWVVTLVDPVDKLKEMYETEVLDKFKEVLKTREEEENASQGSDTDKPQQISISDR
tara:strand:+ start:136 stop:552 length:417 start_codon:yes stop_codon:yes gene_type:complete